MMQDMQYMQICRIDTITFYALHAHTRLKRTDVVLLAALSSCQQDFFELPHLLVAFVNGDV